MNAPEPEKKVHFTNKVVIDLYGAYDMPLDEFSQNLLNQKASELKLPSIYCEASYRVGNQKFRTIRSSVKAE